MKVVLFCGGFGMRLREFSESIPKPMVNIGYRPILWHVMKYYAHYGHKDFILCLGWKADVIKQYFLRYDECISNDFVLTGGGADVQLLNRDIHDWNITFVDTGTAANIGQRLKAVQPFLEGEEMFLANYTDGLSDRHLPDMISAFKQSGAVASFLAVKPTQSFHAAKVDDDGTVRQVARIEDSDVLMNGGFMVFRNEFWDYLQDGEEIVDEPFQRLIAERRLFSLKYDGFWSCMDTFKEKQCLDDMYAAGFTPWEVWKNPQREDALHLPPATPSAEVTDSLHVPG
jgi:glucose-1-phosphate cytidylyltransferase